ncbi:MAG: IS66 family transposase [bacterium]|nr:IS66 family transposase [bacterium]
MSTATIETKQVDLDVVRSIMAEVADVLDPDKFAILEGLLNAHLEVVRLLHTEGTKLARLRRLFGLAKSERTEKVLKGTAAAPDDDAALTGTPDDDTPSKQDTEPKDTGVQDQPPSSDGPNDGKPSRRPKGAGRRPAADYQGTDIHVPHPHLCVGDRCEVCERGSLYLFRTMVCLVIRGQSPFAADKYNIESLRCNTCGEVFNAEVPEPAKGPKYRASAVALLAALHYTFGMPFYRQDKLQGFMGVPLPASTQWKLVNEGEKVVQPVLAALRRHAAHSHLVHIDDTYLALLDYTIKKDDSSSASGADPTRKGKFTTGLLAVDTDGRRTALFVTGRQHAGENLVDLMKLRPPGSHPPIIVSDALSRNTSGLMGLMMAYYAYCLAHARRGIVDQVDNHPKESQHLLRELAKVFHVDKKSTELGLSPRQRRTYHRKHSGPVLTGLKQWIRGLFSDRRVEPNSDMGRALRYFLRHWSQLTLFLRQPAVPLTNNACERLLKIAIRYRKNSCFYRNRRGALVGDTYMSLAHTAELNGKNPVHYLTALLEHPTEVAAAPDRWLPWTYEATLAASISAPDQPIAVPAPA